MTRLLFDTNVTLDAILRRVPWARDAEGLLQAVEDGRLEGHMSASAVTDVFYIVRRLAETATALAAVRRCLTAFRIIPVTGEVLQRALALPGSDFEDNVQIACAVADGLDAIVTRDSSGFHASPIPALTPAEALARM